MKIIVNDNGLLIEPETDFEESYLENLQYNNKLEVYLKHGMSLSSIIGLKITRSSNKPQKEKNVDS